MSVWSNTNIAQGTLCYPFQGTIRIDKLEVYGQLEDDDVSKLIVLDTYIMNKNYTYIFI